MLYDTFTQKRGITTPAKVLLITAVWNPGSTKVSYDVLDLHAGTVKEIDKNLFQAYVRSGVIRPLTIRDDMGRPLINYELLEKIEHIQQHGYDPHTKPLDKAA